MTIILHTSSKGQLVGAVSAHTRMLLSQNELDLLQLDCPAAAYCPSPSQMLPCPAGSYCVPRATVSTSKGGTAL